MSSRGGESGADISPTLLDDLVDCCRPADVVGISLMTNSFYRARALTEALRRAELGVPVVWGGTHSTVAPEECARIADYVCIGEGERAMLDFVQALESDRAVGRTPNFAYVRDGALVRNSPHALTDDLDDYPFPDYELDDHWVGDKGALVPARPELLRGTLRCYRMSSTRGCPYGCSFCNNATQLRIYRDAGAGHHWVRKRSVESVITEIESVRSRYPKIDAVNLIDDLFLIRSETEVDTFVEAYRRRVNLPLEFDVFPNTVTEAKIAALSRLPIELISMGIQSGCEDTVRKLYNRPTRTETIARAIRIISRYKLPAEYHYLVSNPFETDASRTATLRFAADHHRGPAKLRLFPLGLYPGSALYARARAEGVIGEHHEPAYQSVYRGAKHLKAAHYLEIWLRIVLALRGLGVPSWLVHRAIDVAVHRWVRWCIDRRWFAPAAFLIYRVGRVLHKNLVFKPLVRPVARLRRRRKRRRERASAESAAHARTLRSPGAHGR